MRCHNMGLRVRKLTNWTLPMSLQTRPTNNYVTFRFGRFVGHSLDRELSSHARKITVLLYTLSPKMSIISYFQFSRYLVGSLCQP